MVKKLHSVHVHPDKYSPEFFETLSKALRNLQDFSVIIGADINTVLDPLLDKSTGPP